jgi:hypothetical protein
MKTLNQRDRGLIAPSSIKVPILGPGAPFNLGVFKYLPAMEEKKSSGL